MLDTDRFMRNLYVKLEQDFACCTGYRGKTISSDVSAHRNYDVSLWHYPSLRYTYKWVYQLRSLYKRYRFKDDIYTQAELEEMTNKKEHALQSELSTFKPHFDSAVTRLVTQRVRCLMKEWLGKFSWDDVVARCCFGTKSTVGNPLSQSYLDVKVRNLTGSPAHISLFSDMVEGDSLLSRVLRGSKYEPCAVLKQVNVPKSYKILRGITPNTTLGNFITHGVGEVLEDVCEKLGLSVRTTQRRHAKLVKPMSKTRRYVTADLSTASQRYSLAHLCAFLPREWYNAIKLGRIADIDVGGKVCASSSVMTMGIGFTFPLQTLLFYAILIAVRDLLGVDERLTISVYGDDLIYPVEMHKYIVHVFSRYGFVLNRDKTFNRSFFRESCGADYFYGTDVRPFSPEGEHMLLTGARACSFLYKMYNGLLLRWTREELRYTLAFLDRTILQYSPGGIHQVPTSYPDTSGVKVDKPVWDDKFYPVLSNRNFGFSFYCIVETSKFRRVESQDVYLWDTLRRMPNRELDFLPVHTRPLPRFFRLNSLRYHPASAAASLRRQLHFAKNDMSLRSCDGEEAMQFCWRKAKHPVWEKGVLRKKVRPYVVSRDEGGCEPSTRNMPMWA